jgi:hypothetical protein
MCANNCNSPGVTPKREKVPGLRFPSVENLKPAVGTVKPKFDLLAIAPGSVPALPKSLRSKPSTSSLALDKVADKHRSTTLPRSFIPKRSSPATKSPTSRSSLVTTTQDSDSSPPGRVSHQPSLQARSAGTSLNSPTRSSGLSPKYSDPKQTIRHRRSTLTIPKAPVLLTQLRAERHKSPEDEPVKKCKMTRHSLDQLQAHELDQATRSSDPKRATAAQAAIELQVFPKSNRTPLPSPIRSEGSCSTFFTASEEVESKDECEMDFDPCELGQDPWPRDGPAPFVGANFGQVGIFANGTSVTPALHVPRGRHRVRSSDGDPKSAYTNGTDAHKSSNSTSAHAHHVANLPSTSSRSSQHIQAAIGSSDVITQASIVDGANRSRPRVVGHPRLRLTRPVPPLSRATFKRYVDSLLVCLE